MTARPRRHPLRLVSWRQVAASAAVLILSMPSAIENATGAEPSRPVNTLRDESPRGGDRAAPKPARSEAQKPASKPLAADDPVLRPVRQASHLRPAGGGESIMMSSPEPPSLVAPEPMYLDGPGGYGGGPGGYGGDAGGSFGGPALGGCDSCDGFGCDGGCDSACGIGDPWCQPIIRLDWSRFDLFAGVHGFTGPPNWADTGEGAAARDGAASFGFHEGFNWGRACPALFCGEISSQFGLRATQSNFSEAQFTDESRHQLFLTGGFFRRVDWGFQGGLVVDYLNDEWYYDADLVQLRGELSWMSRSCHEAGFRFTASTQQSSSGTRVDIGDGLVDDPVTWEATNQNLFFYRHHLAGSATAELGAGFTDSGDGLIRAFLDLPMSHSVGLQTGFTYLAPDESSTAIGHQEESWNVGISLVWRPCRTGKRLRDYSRPLFEVADNGSFLVDRVTR